jgi:hypothetical protein
MTGWEGIGRAQLKKIIKSLPTGGLFKFQRRLYQPMAINILALILAIFGLLLILEKEKPWVGMVPAYVRVRRK